MSTLLKSDSYGYTCDLKVSKCSRAKLSPPSDISNNHAQLRKTIKITGFFFVSYLKTDFFEQRKWQI